MRGVTYRGAANLNVVPRRGGWRSVVSEQSGGRSSRSYDIVISSYTGRKIVSAVSPADVPRTCEVTGMVCDRIATLVFASFMSRVCYRDNY